MNVFSSSFIILSESRVGPKYENIWKHIPQAEIVEGGFLKLLKKAILNLRGNTKVIYHIRYLKGGASAYVRYGVIAILKILGIVDVLWSCHNVNEHNIENKNKNENIKKLIEAISFRIIVFHEDLAAFLSPSTQKKIRVACFGDMTSFVDGQVEENAAFLPLLELWKNTSVGEGLLLSVSAAKKNNLEVALEGLKLANVRGVFIAPMVPKPQVEITPEILFFNESFVRREVKELLRMEKVIGFVGHSNISVPTSIYMFASYGVPVIGLNYPPVSSIVEKYSLGKVVSTPEDFASGIEDVLHSYEAYSRNTKLLLEEQSWQISAHIHAKALAEF